MKRFLTLLALSWIALGLSQSYTTTARADTNSDPVGVPILFVTQVPIPADYTTVGSTIGNQKASMDSAPRGGDLWIRYADGTLKNLTSAAGYGGYDTTPGACGGQSNCLGANAIAVRDPAVYWDGTKAVFSMLIGAPTAQYDYSTYHWQLYEVTHLGKNETPVITKVPKQPAQYNNISPTYGTDDRIIFTSDRPRNGNAWLYPQLDEYESAPTVTGLWSLDPTSGDLFLMNHAVSGAFTPFVDSYGRVIFTRWDHLQRDQQADTDYEQNMGFHSNNCPAYCTFNYSDESSAATPIASRAEIFPEPRTSRTDLLQGTNLTGHGFNDFAPWQINEDGTQEETLNHIGRHEFLVYMEPSLNDDPALQYSGTYPIAHANTNPVSDFMEIEQDPTTLTRYFGIDVPEFGTHASGQIISISSGAPNTGADSMAVKYWTPRETSSFTDTPGPDNSGHYRDILPLSNGVLVAAHTAFTDYDSNAGTGSAPASHYDFHLKTLKLLPNTYWGPDQSLTGGLSKTLHWWSPDTLMTFSGDLWEWEPVEVRARTRPQKIVPTVPSIEQSVFTQAGVDLAQFQNYLRSNNLALFVSRNVTQRDDSDLQQPFNLHVPNGVQTLSKNFQNGDKIYTVSFMQFFQADQIRGMRGIDTPAPGRRVLAQFMHDPAAMNANPTVNNAPQSSVAVATDGSVAAFVPARRAMTWQSTDNSGTGVVRERMWITFQPGEVRVCSSCHGVNDKDQAGNTSATNAPQALLQVLQYWKSHNGNSPTATPTATATATQTTNPNATSTYTPTATGTPQACEGKPSAPALLSPVADANVSHERVRLKWNAAACANSYKILVRELSQGTLIEQNNNVLATRYKTIALEAGKTYAWRVSACNANGCTRSGWRTFTRP